MSNHFQNRKAARNELSKLRAQMHTIRSVDDAEHREYMRALRSVIATNPNRTAAQIAAMMADNRDERVSIKSSVGSLAAATEDSKRKYAHVKNPSMPELRRSMRTTTRRFLEIDESGTVINEFTKDERQYTYSVEVY